MDFRYWDANVFLGWLKDEADKVDYCRPVIEAANAGKIGSIRVSQRYFGAFRCFSWVI